MGGPEKTLTWVLQAFDQKGSLCRPAKSGNKTESCMEVHTIYHCLVKVRQNHDRQTDVKPD